MIAHDQAPEHEFEAAHGLPGTLPANEKMLWQGAPDWRLLARDAMHVRGIAIYFGILLAWRGINVLANGGSALDAAAAVAWLMPLALVALGMLSFLAWLIARTSVYTLTDRRIVMRIGIVLSITFNLPYRQVESAGLQARADGSGDLTLLLDESDRIAYLHLWPHAKAWQVKRPQPMLRSLRDARNVASLLSAALADAAGLPRPTRVAPTAVPVTAPVRPVAPVPVVASEAFLDRPRAAGRSHPLAA